MKRFRFSLEQALSWRRLRADIERAKLEQLLAEMRHLELRRVALEQEEIAAQNEVRHHDVIRAPQLIALESFTRHWKKRVAGLEDRRTEIFREIALQQTRLLNAQREHDLLLKVKSQKQHEWQIEFDREQEDLASEAYLAKWSARKPTT